MIEILTFNLRIKLSVNILVTPSLTNNPEVYYPVCLGRLVPTKKVYVLLTSSVVNPTFTK